MTGFPQKSTGRHYRGFETAQGAGFQLPSCKLFRYLFAKTTGGRLHQGGPADTTGARRLLRGSALEGRGYRVP